MTQKNKNVDCHALRARNDRVFKIIAIVASIPVTIFLLAVIVFNIFTKAPAAKNLRHSKKGFVIPYSNKGYIAQGISYDEGSGNFYLTGYMKDGSASPIFVVNKETRKFVNAVRMTNPDGSAFTGHAGGLSVADGKIYIAGSGDCCFYVFDKAAVDNAKRDSNLSYTDVIDVQGAGDKIKVSFSTYHNGLLYAGEFHREPNYKLLDSHQVMTEDGLQYAITAGFSISDGKAIPQVAFSLPDFVQGMCFSDDSIYLTTSWGLGKSYVYKYSYGKLEQSGTKEICGKEVPLYILTLSNTTASFVLPPMAEEIEFVDGRFYITNESASNKYVFGKFTGGRWCRAYDLQ